MKPAEDKVTAQNMISLHGLRAQAIVQERIAECRAHGNAADLSRWESIQAAIAELRRTAPAERGLF